MSDLFWGAFSAVMVVLLLWDLRGARCLLSHKWGDWTQYTKHDITKHFHEGKFIGRSIHPLVQQGRICQRCHLQETRSA